MTTEERDEILEELFANVPREKAPPGLRDSIMEAVRAEARRPAPVELVADLPPAEPKEEQPPRSRVLTFLSRPWLMHGYEAAAALLFIGIAASILQNRALVREITGAGGRAPVRGDQIVQAPDATKRFNAPTAPAKGVAKQEDGFFKDGLSPSGWQLFDAEGLVSHDDLALTRDADSSMPAPAPKSGASRNLEKSKRGAAKKDFGADMNSGLIAPSTSVARLPGFDVKSNESAPDGELGDITQDPGGKRESGEALEPGRPLTMKSSIARKPAAAPRAPEPESIAGPKIARPAVDLRDEDREGKALLKERGRMTLAEAIPPAPADQPTNAFDTTDGNAGLGAREAPTTAENYGVTGVKMPDGVIQGAEAGNYLTVVDKVAATKPDEILAGSVVQTETTDIALSDSKMRAAGETADFQPVAVAMNGAPATSDFARHQPLAFGNSAARGDFQNGDAYGLSQESHSASWYGKGQAPSGQSPLMIFTDLEKIPPIDLSEIEDAAENSGVGGKAGERRQGTPVEKDQLQEPYASIYQTVENYLAGHQGKVLKAELLHHRDPNKPDYLRMTCLAPVSIRHSVKEVFDVKNVVFAGSKLTPAQTSVGGQDGAKADYAAVPLSGANSFNAKATNYRDVPALPRRSAAKERELTLATRPEFLPSPQPVTTPGEISRTRGGAANGKGHSTALHSEPTTKTLRYSYMKTTVDAIEFELYCQPIEINADVETRRRPAAKAANQ